MTWPWFNSLCDLVYWYCNTLYRRWNEPEVMPKGGAVKCLLNPRCAAVHPPWSGLNIVIENLCPYTHGEDIGTM